MSSKVVLCMLLHIAIPFMWIVGVHGQCVVDPSVTEKEKPLVEDIIKLLQPLQGQKLTVQGVGVTYSVAVCADAVNDSPYGNASVVEVHLNNSEVVGQRNRTLAARGDGWLFVHWLSPTNYTDGSCEGRHRSTRLLLTCDETRTSPSSLSLSLVLSPSSECGVVLSGGHSVACTTHHDTGLGGFSVLLIIVAVCAAVYFVMGFAYLRFAKGAHGINQIPHRLVWFRVGNAFADCVGTVCRCDKYCGVPETDLQDYASVVGSGGDLYGPGDGSVGGEARGYHESGYPPMAGGINSRDRDELLPPRRPTQDADLIQP